MAFVPAGEIIGDRHEVRTVVITDNPALPDGEYKFIDMHCVDDDCDCRKTMVSVYHNGEYVSLINFGWAPVSFYRKWAHGDYLLAKEMVGASLDFQSPDRVNREGILSLFKTLMDKKWDFLIRRH